MRKYIGIALIIVGILIIFLPALNTMLIKNNVENNLKYLDQLDSRDIEANLNREVDYDYSQVRDVGVLNTIVNRGNIDKEYIVGEIIIDDLDIHLPILNGTTNKNLLHGATTMRRDQRMGEGNYPLAGHYMKDHTLFGKLIYIEEGTSVKIIDKEYIYEYIIYDTLLVPETAMYMLENKRWEERGKPIISLMTCYYTSTNGKRFFALGELKDIREYEYMGN